MLRHFLRLTINILSKNKLFTLVNFFGLAIGMSAFIIISVYVRFELSYDTFHTNSGQIYRLKSDIFKNNEPVQSLAQTYPKVGPTLKNDYGEVIDFLRLFPINGGALVSTGENHFNEDRIFFADPSFFKLFSYEFERAQDNVVLAQPNMTIVTSSIAKKYFGNHDPIGQSITFHWYGNKIDFVVEGVVEDPPMNTHLKYNILFSYETLKSITNGESEQSWGWNNFYTYLLLTPDADVHSLEEKLLEFSSKHLASDQKHDQFTLQPLESIHLDSALLDELEPGGSRTLVYLMMIVGAFVLIIAWINYINLSIARSSERAKEVAIRKINGATARNLILQFLAESFLINLMAMALTITVLLLSIPFFYELTGVGSHIEISKDPFLWLVLACVFVVGVLASGLYPAFVISSFKPIRVFGGDSKSGRQFLRTAFVTFQYAAATFLIICILTIYEQTTFLKNKDLAVNIENILVVEGPKNANQNTYPSDFNRLQDFLESQPSVNNYASSSAVPGIPLNGIMQYIRLVNVPETEASTFYGMQIDHNFIDTYKVHLLAGRNFSRNSLHESQSIIFNEAGIELLGFKNADEAINKRIIGPENTEVEIVGVVKNFHQLSPRAPYYPAYYTYSEFPNPKIYYSIRINQENADSFIPKLEKQWKAYFPGSAFEYFYAQDFFNEQYNGEVRFGRIIALFTIVAILITCLGFFALVSFNTVMRAKEIAIRKALGASSENIVVLFYRDFLKLIFIANIIACPIAYVYLNTWLDNFAFKVGIHWSTFFLSLCLLIVISFITVGANIYKAARSNIVNVLKESW